MFRLLLSNPIRSVIGIIGIAVFAAMSLMAWQIKHLSRQTSQQRLELIRYEENFNELIRIQAIREKIIENNINEMIKRNKQKTKILVDIEGIKDEEDDSVGPVIINTIDSLRND